jgi:hypothetical protein
LKEKRIFLNTDRPDRANIEEKEGSKISGSGYKFPSNEWNSSIENCNRLVLFTVLVFAVVSPVVSYYFPKK